MPIEIHTNECWRNNLFDRRVRPGSGRKPFGKRGGGVTVAQTGLAADEEGWEGNVAKDSLGVIQDQLRK